MNSTETSRSFARTHTEPEDLVVRVSINQLFDLTDDGLRYASQLGAAGICLLQPNTPDDRYDFIDFVNMRTRCEEYGMRLESIEGVPVRIYDKVMLGLPGRDEQIERYQRMIRNIGAAGIPVLGFHWVPNFVWRTSHTTPTRGGAQASSFDYEMVKSAPFTHGREFTAEEMQSNFDYFMGAVLPVAEEAEVALALHPDDPPVAMLGGIARIFGSREAFQKALERWPSPAFKLLFCLGSWSEMGPGALDSLRLFAEQGRVAYLHMRDVQGHVPKFAECFLGDGNVDIVEVVRTLHDVGFDGCLIDDHVPRLIGDPEWCDKGRAWTTGYLHGLVSAISR
jgi:mannonate dehydratase